jgi:hypothetical protein
MPRTYSSIDKIRAEVLQFAVDFQEKLIQMPSITEATLPPLQFPGVVTTKLLTPMSNRFVGNNDASLCQQIFDVTETQAETMIKPDGMADDFRGEPMAVIARTTGFHPVSLAVHGSN